MTLQLHDFLIMGKKDFIGDTLAYAKLAAVSFEYASIVKGKGKEIEIKSIHLTKPLVNMRILSNGDANYAIFHSDSMARDTSRFNININRWEIEDGRFILYDRPQRSYLDRDHDTWRRLIAKQLDLVKDAAPQMYWEGFERLKLDQHGACAFQRHQLRQRDHR